MHLALVAIFREVLNSSSTHFVTSSLKNLCQSIHRWVTKAAVDCSEFCLCKMMPGNRSFWLQNHPGMSPFSYNRYSDSILLNNHILEVVKLYTHVVHILQTEQKWSIEGNNVEGNSTQRSWYLNCAGRNCVSFSKSNCMCSSSRNI